jgi:hypothetical protein
MYCLIAGNIVGSFSLINLQSTFLELQYRILDEEVHLQLVEIDVGCFCVSKWQGPLHSGFRVCIPNVKAVNIVYLNGET